MIRFGRRLRFIARRREIWPIVLLLGLALAPVAEASAQSVDDDSLQQAARTDYHGPDLRGKDGPLANVGMDLLLLYHRWTSGAADRQGVSGSLQVQNGRVTVDAIAAGTAPDLASDLKRLGATNVATAGALVSAQIPIPSIPDAARLPTLQSMRPSRPRTQQSGPGAVSGAVRMRPADSAEAPAPSESATDPATGSASARADTAASAPRGADPSSRPATDAVPSSSETDLDDAASDRSPEPMAVAPSDPGTEGETAAQTEPEAAPAETAVSAATSAASDEADDGAFLFLVLLLVVTVFVTDEM